MNSSKANEEEELKALADTLIFVRKCSYFIMRIPLFCRVSSLSLAHWFHNFLTHEFSNSSISPLFSVLTYVPSTPFLLVLVNFWSPWHSKGPLNRGNLNWENAFYQIGLYESCGAFSWLMVDVGGQTHYELCLPWAGPVMYKKDSCSWFKHTEEKQDNSFCDGKRNSIYVSHPLWSWLAPFMMVIHLGPG